MKILHLITRLDFGGSSENVMISAEGSAKAGHHVLIAAGPTSTSTETARMDRVELISLQDLVRAIDPVRDFKAFFEILSLIRRTKPDVVHTHSSKAGILGRWSAWVYGKFFLPAGTHAPKIIHTPHGHVFYGYFDFFGSRLFIFLEQITARVTDNLVALSEGEKRESLERGVGSPDQWVVIPSGISALQTLLHPHHSEVDADLRRRIPGESIVVGCIARLDPVKGVQSLVDAAVRVRSHAAGRNAVFLIIGDGELRRDLEERSRTQGVLDTVIFTGYEKDPWKFLQIMDIYVQPSINEGMGKALVMAQAAGLPAVASRVCGIPDVVRDGDTGLLTPPSDPDALAAAILRLLEDNALRESLGEAAQTWALSLDETGYARFSAEAMVARLSKLYGR